MGYEKWIRIDKSSLANAEDNIIRCELALRGRGESSIIRY